MDTYRAIEWVRYDARTLKRPGKVLILAYDSQTAYALTSTDGITTATYTATLTTTEQTFPIPPGILTSGTPYFFQISAIDTPIDMASHPFRSAPEYASADVITDVIQP